MAAEALVRVENLTRYYGGRAAVIDVSFSVARGEVVALLGPNGAGKSTTLQMLSGALAPTTGRIWINGFDIVKNPQRAKADIGFLPDQPPLYHDMTVNEYLRFCARLRRVARGAVAAAVRRVVDLCGLDTVNRTLLVNLSKGYAQRVGLAQALVHRPAVLILDEPTVGLDPLQLQRIRQLIGGLRKEHGIILSTHMLAESQALCDRALIMNEGRLVFSQSLADLAQRGQFGAWEISLRQPPGEAELARLPGVRRVAALGGGRFTVWFDDDQDGTEALLAAAVAGGWRLTELAPAANSLERAFLSVICGETTLVAAPQAAELRS